MELTPTFMALLDGFHPVFTAGCRNGLLWNCGSGDLDFRFWLWLLWLGQSLGYLVRLEEKLA